MFTCCICNRDSPREMYRALRRQNTDISHDGGDNRKRRKSAPSGPVQMSPDPTQTSKISGIPNRVVKALKRTKSQSKIERSQRAERYPLRPTKEDIEEFESPSMFGSHHIKPSRSHESLNLGPQSTLEAIDLSGNDLVVRPLHSSILGQDHCFQIKTSLGSKYYSCRSASERDKWIESILSAHYPDKDEKRRTDSSLNIWVVEAKNIPQKKKYFCEICLDDSLYARTTPKQRNDMVFWGEQFTFKCLPAVEAINVHVYKEIEKKKRRDKNYIGVVYIPVNMVNSKTTVESWYPISSPINFRGDAPSVRIKARYQNISILPISQYSEFAQYLKEHSVSLCQRLEQEIGVRTKEEVATSLMKVLHCLGNAKEFLTEMVMKETESIKDESLVFRANTMATKSMEAYMKLIGGKYLQDTLGDFIQYLYMTNEDCEVDPERIVGGTLAQHQASLMVMCEMACCKILNSSAAFPSDLRAIFHQLKQRFGERINGDEVCTKLISGCIFLRFLCPAIMSPSLFELIQEYPNEKTSRCLTLIAKTVQALANFTKFGTKESYMFSMNDFLEREWSNMKVFLQEISSATDKSHAVKFSGYIDLGRELALTHSLLAEAMEKFDKPTKEKLSPLPAVLARITKQINEPDKLIPYQSGSLTIGTSVTSATSSTMTTTAASQAKKNLSKIFEDAEPSTAGDVEMLPPYDVAMDKTITKSSTINSLVDFIQQDSDSGSLIAKLDCPGTYAKNVDITVDPRHTKVELSNIVVSQSEIEVNVSPECTNTGAEHSVQMDVLKISEDGMRTETSLETKEKSSHVYTVRVETVCSNSLVGRTISTSNTSKPKNGDNPQNTARTLPLSFSNPAFQLSSRALRQRDAGTDSMSSVTSTPSNGADSDMSNLDGDVSHCSSSSGASPPHQRRDRLPKGQSNDSEEMRIAPGCTNTMANTLPRASSRTHVEMIGDVFLSPDIHTSKNLGNNSIHSQMTLPSDMKSRTTASDNSQPVMNSPEAVKATSNAHRQAFFSVLAPREPPNGSEANSNNQSTQTSEATFLMSSGDKDLPEFSVSMPNPRSALPHSYGNPICGSAQSAHNEQKSHSEMLTTVKEHKSSDNIQTAHIRITPSATKHIAEPLITPTTHTTPVMKFPELEAPFLGNKNRTANNSTGLSQNSPPLGQFPRRNIITQYSYKPNKSLESSTTTISHQDVPVTETTSLHIETKPSRVQSGQGIHRMQSALASGQVPVWTRRREESPKDSEAQTESSSQAEHEAQICSLKEELDRMASQLAEAKRQLEEEEVEAEAALADMKLKVEKTEMELKVQKEEKDQQIRDVISRLMCVEEELRAEQEEMRGVVKAKQKIIDAQEIRIQSLDMANQRLMRALQALKQRCVTSQH